MLSDDLPWPELGNVSRGATRGNQGQKGALSLPDHEGRCILQLRVQPGVLVVRLNRQSSDWYRVLDGEVTRALKLTKTYWRKARRRQDYDPRADQDHIELHEWLQQLKDKTMSHLELLMQKGDILGPPYSMPDDIELTFLRKFIDRHNAGIPHNPRLRNGNASDWPVPHNDESMNAGTPEPSEPGSINGSDGQIRGTPDNSVSHPVNSSDNPVHPHVIETSPTPSPSSLGWLVQETHSSREALLNARAKLSRAQNDSHEAFQAYSTSLELERQARHEVHAAEKRQDDLMFTLLSRTQSTTEQISRRSSTGIDNRRGSPGCLPDQIHEHPLSPEIMRPNGLSPKPINWRQPEPLGFYSDESSALPHLDDHAAQLEQARKHPRNWDQSDQLHLTQSNCEPQEATFLPPRKRVHHLPDRLDIQNNASVLPQDISFGP
jgi:hypothetical protein